MAGEYVNEYMWTFEFDEAGEKIMWQKEFMALVMVRDFWPKSRESMAKVGR